MAIFVLPGFLFIQDGFNIHRRDLRLAAMDRPLVGTVISTQDKSLIAHRPWPPWSLVSITLPDGLAVECSITQGGPLGRKVEVYYDPEEELCESVAVVNSRLEGWPFTGNLELGLLWLIGAPAFLVLIAWLEARKKRRQQSTSRG